MRYVSVFAGTEVGKKATQLAVSDNGTVCYAGDGFISIATADRVSTAVLDSTSITADPYGNSVFAVTDKTGIVFRLHQGTQKVRNSFYLPISY